MRKFKFLTVILSLMVFFGLFAGCSFTSGSKHVCESECDICGGCMNEECTKKACKEKCTCEEEPEHTCESVCPECGGCTDAACEEAACENKCDCEEEPAPEHTCESVCPDCGGCTDLDCEEAACENKCDCEEEPAPEHTCESVCPDCGGCTDLDCEEAACENKCDCEEEPAPEHTCESVCSDCGGCTDVDCEEAACENKCDCEEEPAPEHTCESVCPICQKCTDTECTEAACADKCQGHHTCESVCEECGKCTDAECEEEACSDKCQGHAPHACESICEICGQCEDMLCTEEVCEDKCLGHTVVNPNWDTYELNFMSFNINWAASSPTADTGETSWSNRKVAVLDFINTSGANIIALQEVANWKAESVNQVIYLQNNLASNYELIFWGDEVSLATVYDKTVFNLVRTEKYWLSETPDEMSTCWENTTLYRAVGILILQHRETGEIVRALNTHGPLPDGTISEQLSIRCFELIANRSLSGENDPFTVMLGDFNVDPGELGYVPIAEKLQDCRITAETSATRDYNTYNGYGKRPDVSAEGQSKRQIDYCFVPKHDGVKVLTYEVRNDRFGEENYYLSDHFAIQVTVRVYKNTEDAWSGFH